MSNNAHVNDDEIEIHQLPEVTALQSGMMVAVDSQPTGTKSFNLTTALESKASASDFTALENTVAEKANASDMTTALEGKVDAPATTPAEGQVLTFNGSANTWANPPESVYILNYSDITSYDDIDAERAGSQPTFIKIDSSVQLTVQGISGPTTINMENQIMQLTDYNVYNGWHVFRGYNIGSFPGNSPTCDRVGSSYHFEIVLQIFRPEVTQNTKLWSVFGDCMDGTNVFYTEPQPYTVSYSNGRGGDLSGKTGRSTAVQFTASNGEYRKNLLMPYEIQEHDFSTDETPEQIQFMGWGATSNRAGYKSCLVATQNNASYPAQTPKVSFNKYIMGSTEQSDNVGVSLTVEMISSTAGQASSSYGGNLVPTLGTVGALQYWSDNNGAHYGFKPVNEVPASTPSDEGKVLSVNASGDAGWSTVGSPVTLSRHWEKSNGDYNDNTQQLDFDVSASGIKSAIVVIQMTLDIGKYVLFNTAGIDMYNNEFDVRENYIQNNSDFNGIRPSATTIIQFNAGGIKSIRIKPHGSQQHKFSTETIGIDMLVMGYK